MEIAKIILEYLKVLIWPTVVLLIVFIFRESLQSLIGEIKEIKIKEISIKFERTLTEFIETIKNASSLEEVQFAAKIFEKRKIEMINQKEVQK